MIKKSKLFYKGPGREHVREYSTGQLGGSCSRFKVILKYLPTFLISQVTESLRVWISTTPGMQSYISILLTIV